MYYSIVHSIGRGRVIHRERGFLRGLFLFLYLTTSIIYLREVKNKYNEKESAAKTVTFRTRNKIIKKNNVKELNLIRIIQIAVLQF